SQRVRKARGNIGSSEMKKRFVIPVVIEEFDDHSGYLAVCSVIQGCHAEGATVAEALDNLEDVARILLELQVEDGQGLPSELLSQDLPATLRLRAEIPVYME